MSIRAGRYQALQEEHRLSAFLANERLRDRVQWRRRGQREHLASVPQGEKYSFVGPIPS